jgi:hypothetical protein
MAHRSDERIAIAFWIVIVMSPGIDQFGLCVEEFICSILITKRAG